MIQFIENHFVDSYYPTIENTFSKSIKYNGVEYECDIIDTAGQVGPFFPSYLPLPTLTISLSRRTSTQSSTPNTR